jgi:hypothetical protein
MWLCWRILLLAGASCCWGCEQREVEGITIDGTLTDQQDYTTNWRICRLISRSLHHDDQALAELVALNRGGATHCYHLANVVTQILVRVGEPGFMQMTANFSAQQQRDVRKFLEIGLNSGRYTMRKRPSNSIREQAPDLDRQLAK